jgi:membrane fusion protein, heavy metal efflux system
VRKRHVLTVGLGCLAIGLSAACGRAGEGEPATAARVVGASASGGALRTDVIVVPPDSPRFQQLRVEPVRIRDFPTDEVVAPGRITINPNRLSRVLPPVQGRVLDVTARLGDVVEQSQPLVALDSPDADAAISAFLQAEASDRQALVTLARADADFKRATDLFEHRAVAEKDVLAARNDLAQAQAASQNARATRQQTRRKLQLLGLEPSDFKQPVVVRAPISGTVTEINVTPGEYRAAVSFSTDTATPLMSIADLSTVWMSSEVAEPFIRFIRVGDRVDIGLVAYPGEVFTGRVARIASDSIRKRGRSRSTSTCRTPTDASCPRCSVRSAIPEPRDRCPSCHPRR